MIQKMEVKTVVIINDFNYTQGGASKVSIDTAKLLLEKVLKFISFQLLINQKKILKELNI